MRILAILFATALTLTGCKVSAACKDMDASCSFTTYLLLFPRTLVPKFLYAVNQNVSGTISMYSIDEWSGAVTALNPTSAVYGNQGAWFHLDPERNFGFVDDVGTNVYTFAINQQTGNLTLSATTPNGPNSNPFVVEPTGKFAYGTNNGTTNINIYSYNSTTGAVTLIGTATNTGAGATQSTIMSNSGRALYTSNQSGNVSQFSINSTTGALTSLGGPIAVTAPSGICTDSNDRWLYAVTAGAATVAGFNISSNGTLTLMSGSPFALPVAGALHCTVSPDGGFLITGATQLHVLPINQTTGIPGTATSYGSGNHSGVAMNSGGTYLYSGDNGTTTVKAYRFSKLTGAVTLINTAPCGTQPSGVTLVNLYSY